MTTAVVLSMSPTDINILNSLVVNILIMLIAIHAIRYQNCIHSNFLYILVVALTLLSLQSIVLMLSENVNYIYFSLKF